MGKTILCEKVIGVDYIVEISGADFNGEADFWAVVAAKAGLPYTGEITTEREVIEESGTEKNSCNEKFMLTKDKVIPYYKENEKVLVIDDFHYASREMQMSVGQQLKDAIRRELKVVVVSLPHRSNDAIRQNHVPRRVAPCQPMVIKDKYTFEAYFNKIFDGKKVRVIILQPVKM